MAKKRAKRAKQLTKEHKAAALPAREVMSLIDAPLLGGSLLGGGTGTDPTGVTGGTTGPTQPADSTQLASGGLDSASQTTTGAASSTVQNVTDAAASLPAGSYDPSQTAVSQT